MLAIKGRTLLAPAKARVATATPTAKRGFAVTYNEVYRQDAEFKRKL